MRCHDSGIRSKIERNRIARTSRDRLLHIPSIEGPDEYLSQLCVVAQLVIL